MYSNERSLVARFQNKPFALLGVDTDDTREQLKSAIEQNGLTWRSWWDGTPGGPITRAWKVSSFPTIYLIDAHGVIRYQNPPHRQLGEIIQNLVREAENKPTS
jgi:hypothetical protein